ncbi:MAG TPA: hypothetical protein VMS29_01655 [Pyrinomonadaceae bacterium]|nr:hypothetical protein [Pyrinomonadaceae bacterium]
MAGFTFWTKSADGKMKGSVPVNYIRGKLMQKQIEGVSNAHDGMFVELHFTDGARVEFTLKGDFGLPEVLYFESGK